jgi:hypothetical protein
VAIHYYIDRQGQRIVRQIAVRMPIELLCLTRMLRPDLHRVMAENDALLANPNLGKRVPKGEQVLDLPCHFVLVSVNEMDRLATKLIATEGDCLRSSNAEVTKEIEHVSRFHRRIHAFHDGRIHLLRTGNVRLQ